MATQAVAAPGQSARHVRIDRVFGKALPYLFVGPAVLTLAVLMVYPILQVIYLSVWSNYMIVRDPRFVGLDNFRWIFEQAVFSRILSNTLIFSIASVALHLTVGLGLAMLLSARIDSRARAFFRGILILPWMFTAAVVALNWRLILNPCGIFNALLSELGLMSLSAPLNWLGEVDLALPAMILINLWRGYPFVMLMLLAGLQSVPVELFEQASVDGAGAFARFRYVTIPGIRPVIASVGLLDMIWSLRLFDLVYLTTGGGPLNATHVLATYTYQLAFVSFEFGKASAVAVLMVLFTSVLTLLYFRFQGEA